MVDGVKRREVVSVVRPLPAPPDAHGDRPPDWTRTTVSPIGVRTVWSRTTVEPSDPARDPVVTGLTVALFVSDRVTSADRLKIGCEVYEADGDPWIGGSRMTLNVKQVRG